MTEVRCAQGASQQKKKIFKKMMRTHHDQVDFKKTRNRKDLIYITNTTGSGAESVKRDITAEELEELISQIVPENEDFEKRVLSDSLGSKDSEKLEQQNQEMRQRISNLESQLDEIKKEVSQNTENIEAIDEKTDRMIERFTEVSNQIMDRLDEIAEKQESEKEEPEQIRNRRE